MEKRMEDAPAALRLAGRREEGREAEGASARRGDVTGPRGAAADQPSLASRTRAALPESLRR